MVAVSVSEIEKSKSNCVSKAISLAVVARARGGHLVSGSGPDPTESGNFLKVGFG